MLLLCCCALFAAALAASDCDNATYGPVRVTNPHLYPYAVLVVRVEPAPTVVYGQVGTVIRDRVVLAQGYVGESHRVDKWGVAGASLTNLPGDLRGVPVYPAARVEINPEFNPQWRMSAYNMALLFLERSDENLVPAWLPTYPDPPQKVISVYWRYDAHTHRLLKYMMSWCPDVEGVRPKCSIFNRESYLCLTTRMDGVPMERIQKEMDFPCGKDVVSYVAGGPVVAQESEELLGMFLGIENEGTMDHLGNCRVPKWGVVYFAAIQLLGAPKENLEAGKNYIWIEDAIERFYTGAGIKVDESTATVYSPTPCKTGSTKTTRKRPYIYPAATGSLREFNAGLLSVFILVSRLLRDF